MNDEGGVSHLTGVMFIRAFIFSLNIWKPHPSPPGLLILHVKDRFFFFTTGRRGTSPTRGPPPPSEQALLMQDSASGQAVLTLSKTYFLRHATLAKPIAKVDDRDDAIFNL